MTVEGTDDRIILRHPGIAEMGRVTGGGVADAVNRWVGTWTFLALQNLLIVAWCLANHYSGWAPDPFPFVFLNLLLSMQSANTGPMLLISANRAAAHDRAVLYRIDEGMRRINADHEYLRATFDQYRTNEQRFRTEVLNLLRGAHSAH